MKEDLRDLHERALQIDALSSAIARGGSALGNVPALVRSVLDTGSWREFITKMGEHVCHERFEDFVTEPPLAGLGADMALVKRLCADDSVTSDLIDMEEKRPVGRPRKEMLANSKGFPSGTTKQQALRRLRKDRPDLHAQVLEGRLSAHRAMVEAGFRHRTATIPIDDPELTAAALIRTLGKRNLKQVVERLQTFL